MKNVVHVRVEKLRKMLSMNIKQRRKLLGISQEKLAEAADLSAQTMNDIEGCRMWVSDKTIVKLAQALQVEVYQLLIPIREGEDPESVPSPVEILLSLQHTIKRQIDLHFDELFRSGLLR
ncbi:MAG: helix-turn-helix domain-containing protein [Treponema sp.]|jgi:transcriptional regulator with XRE-family HTH domain|nr:helix-turn-helix domain-containing protein [Treponema sp.]